VGVTERANLHRQQLDKQRKDNEERLEAHHRKISALENGQVYYPDMDFTAEDHISIMDKLQLASEKFDKHHPAASSLKSFDTVHMPAGIFRENIKAVFGVKATPKEIGYLLSVYDKEQSGKINTKDFLINFFAAGKEARDAKRKAALEKQRETLKTSQEIAEQKVLQLTEKLDFVIDSTFTNEDYSEAERRMVIASKKYDKTHLSAPNLDGFAGSLSAGAFRELMKRAFSIYFTSKEVGAILKRFHVEGNENLIDGKRFIIYFIRLGFEARSEWKAKALREQRQTLEQIKSAQEKKLIQALQKIELELAEKYSDADREEAMKKLIDASAQYDKNAPGCVSLDAFDAKFLTPGVFREVVKRTFNVLWTSEELAAMVAEFDNGGGNVDTSKFLVAFIKMGAEERERRKAVELDKRRRTEILRAAKEKLKQKRAESKMALEVNYRYTEDEKAEAFEKLAIAAKKYDKSHPAAMSLEGFEQKSMKPHVFREMLKRTFNYVSSPEEMGALMHCFDPKKTGEVSSHRFLAHFLKLGISEREKELKESLRKLREDAANREKYHRDMMAAQWAKAELNVEYNFTEDEKMSAMKKLTIAATQFDPASAGSMGLAAFQASVLSPAIFREMLKRCFNMKLTNGELAALISTFDQDGTKNVSCSEFMVTFINLGFERRGTIRTAQLEKQRKMKDAAKTEVEEKLRQADLKMEAILDPNFTDEDFNSMLNKIRLLAANYDRSHTSAPSLQGFTGTDMKPNEFKHMLLRTFNCNLTAKELSALVAYFPSQVAIIGAAQQAVTASPKPASRSGTPGGRIDTIPRIGNQAFLAYFNKIQREEQDKRQKQRLARDRDFLEAQKISIAESERKKAEELQEHLRFTEEDEISAVAKLKHAAKEYATDSAPYQEPLQGFKGPALPPDKFRDLFHRVFAVKFTYPEVGMLLSILDQPGLGVFDGWRFLTWFYRLSRIEEKYLLGESGEQLDLEVLRRIAILPTRVNSPSSPRSRRGRSSSSKRPLLPSRASQSSQSPFESSAPTRKPLTAASQRDAFEQAFGCEDSCEESANAAKLQAFSQATLQQHWFLPSVILTAPSTARSNPRSEGEEDVHQHLRGLFECTSTPVDRSQSWQPTSTDSFYAKKFGAYERRNRQTTPAASKAKRCTASGSQSPKRSTSPKPRLVVSSSSAQSEDQERNFLSALFSSTESLSLSLSSPKKGDRALLDPVAHLLKHSQHSYNPVVSSKSRQQPMQQQRVLAPVQPRKKSHQIKSEPACGKAEGDGKASLEEGEGGFYFPLLPLATSVSALLSTPEEDRGPDSLRAILLS
jgi:Ca2+-binding EF-hand superfamily protein